MSGRSSERFPPWSLSVVALAALAVAAAACGPSRGSENAALPSPEPSDTPAAAEEWDPDRLPPPPEITFIGSTATYRGPLEVEYARDFLDRVARYGTAIKTLVIDSGGGDTLAGMDIGEWVHEHGVTVVVDSVCFSSCANYIFTAAPNKTIREDAFVGWHGSEQQNRFFDEEFANANPDDLPGACRERPLSVGEDPNRELSEGYERELRFLERIGLRVDALVWAMTEHARCRAYMQMDVDGWTFDIPSMERLGIANVSYEGPGDYPSEVVVEQGGIAVYEVGDSDLE